MSDSKHVCSYRQFIDGPRHISLKGRSEAGIWCKLLYLHANCLQIGNLEVLKNS